MKPDNNQIDAAVVLDSAIKTYAVFLDPDSITDQLVDPALLNARRSAQRAVLDAAEQLLKARAGAPTSSPLGRQIGGGHYKDLAIQPIEYCQRNRLNYCESNVVKYVTRHREKGGAEDLQKAIHNLELLLQLEYPTK